MYKLSLVIPCYNEEKTLRKCIERIMQLKDESLDIEIVIVDDCSTDNSLSIARSIAQSNPNIMVNAHEKNMGKGAALRTGFMNATGDFVGINDADDEYNPMEYKVLLEPLIEGKADVAYGSRYLRPGTRRVLYYWHSQMNRFLTNLSNMYTDLGITDMETCYKVFRRDVIQSIAPNLRENRFGFEPEVTSLVAASKCRVYECAISYNPRTYEEGKKINWRDGVRALYCIMHYGGQTAPLPMQLIVYFFIGLICAIVNIAIFWFANKTVGLLPAVVIAFIIAAALNYVLCILVLFKHKARWSASKEMMTYVIGVILMCLFDYAVTYGCIHMGMTPMVAKIIGTGLGFIANFLIRKYWIF